MDSPFDVLGVDEDADEREIQRAYRERVIETHPDQGGSTAAFQRVQRAYEAIDADESVETWEPDPDSVDGVDPEPSLDTRVEYLNYAVLDDYGWAIGDADLFEKAADADLGEPNYGEMAVEPGESLLEAAEDRGFAWPYACRGGACANCAVVVVEGELSLPTDHILPPELTDRDVRLSCNGRPVTDEMQVVYNVKHLPDLEALRLPPYPFELAQAND